MRKRKVQEWENTAVFQKDKCGDEREERRESRGPAEKVVIFQEGTWACEVSLVGS